jgi:hypothetical protein
MIRLPLPGLVLVYTLLFLCVIFAAWMAYGGVRRLRDRRALRHRIQCAVCGMLYEDPTEKELPACPRCGSLNERLTPRIH